MQPTIYLGVVAALIALIFAMRNRVRWAWMFFAICQVFGATSVASLTALGGASLAVSQIGVAVLLFVALFGIAPSDSLATNRSIQIHIAGICIIVYTLIISIFGPRMFAGQMDLIAVRPDVVDGAIVSAPLGPRSSNITHAAYLIGSFLTAIATSMLFARKLSAADFRNAVLAAGALHAGFGIIDAAGAAIGMNGILDFLRNANFNMLDQSFGAVKRLSGSLAEPASYATFSVPFAVFGIEEWLRSRKPVAGLIGVLIWVMALASTSTTAIISAAAYAVVLLPRLVASSGNFLRSTLLLVGVIGVAGLALAALCLAQPEIARSLGAFLGTLTVDKVGSDSAAERSAWAMQGWQAFRGSMGLGTGAGTFRSSSLVFAVLGSLGVIGSLLMLVFIAQIARVTFVARNVLGTQRSAGWAALLALVPAAVSAVTPDPGFVFALFAGFALHPLLATATMPGRTRMSSELAFEGQSGA